MYKKIVAFTLLFISVIIFADYSLDSNKDGNDDVWVEETADGGYIINSDKDFDGMVDSKLTMDHMRLTTLEESDYNLDGIMDNFYYYEDGYVVRQEVDSNYDQKIDIWVYITNNGTAILKYEKDLDYDGVIDKIKEFEVVDIGKQQHN